MEINYTLTEDDYLNFNLFHTKNSKTVLRSLTIQRFIGPIIFLIFSYVFSTIASLPFLGLFITFSIMSIIWFLFYPKYFYSLVIRNTKKMIKEGNNEGLLGKHEMILMDEGIVDTTSTGKTEVNWSGIQNIKEDADSLYLYNSSVSAYILPKRELTNIDEVKNFLASKLAV